MDHKSQLGRRFTKSASLCGRWATRYTFVCLSCVLEVTTASVRRRRRTPTVHLAGSFILIQLLLAVSVAYRRQRSDNVLTPVSTTSDVLLLSGLHAIRAVRYITWDLTHVRMILTSHSLTSSGDVTVCQVHDITMYLYIILCCKFYRWYLLFDACA